ncbi:hypothetical protein FQR65_LT05492 [Abscondita terminalis]|nr:hypothetical protein FQR65_LT05492 [Abscondita terminalis]
MKIVYITLLLKFLIILPQFGKGNFLEIKNADGETPLLMAAKKSLQLTKMLIAAGADVNVTDKYGVPVLHHAVNYNQYEIVKVLIDNNVNINCITKFNETALFWTTFSDVDLNITDLLISVGVNINFPNQDGVTPIHYAIMKENRNAFDNLLKNQADVDMKNINGVAPLHTAAEKDVYYIRGLLDHGANINIRNGYNNTPLHLAVQERKPDIVQELLVRGSDRTAQNNKGDTPLHTVIRFNYIDIAELFLTIPSKMYETEIV